MICNFSKVWFSRHPGSAQLTGRLRTKKALTKQSTGDVVSKEEDRPGDGWDSAPDDWEPDALASGNNKPPLLITAFNCIYMHIPAYVAL